MTEEIKNKLKSVIDAMGIIGSDIADYIIDIERETLVLLSENARLQEAIDTEQGLNKDAAGEIELYQHENADLEKDKEYLDKVNNEQTEVILKLNEQIEKMKCCGNCGNERCTSKYRGNSCYHRQEDGYACADNEDWIPRKDK